jgi:hypothetical protein
MSKRKSTAVRKIRSIGTEAIKYTGNVSSKAGAGLFKWATTDHSRMSEAFDNMPSMGFIDSLKYLLFHFLLNIFVGLLGGFLMFVLIAYGIPLLYWMIFGDW